MTLTQLGCPTFARVAFCNSPSLSDETQQTDPNNPFWQKTTNISKNTLPLLIFSLFTPYNWYLPLWFICHWQLEGNDFKLKVKIFEGVILYLAYINFAKITYNIIYNDTVFYFFKIRIVKVKHKKPISSPMSRQRDLFTLYLKCGNTCTSYILQKSVCVDSHKHLTTSQQFSMEIRLEHTVWSVKFLSAVKIRCFCRFVGIFA